MRNYLARVSALVGTLATLSVALLASHRVVAAEPAKLSYYLIGNSLTWDTLPERLTGDVQWHVDCGVPLPFIHANPDKPCVKSSSQWPKALAEKQYDFISVQPHYGSTLTQDIETISAWMKLQPRAVFVIHSGWARHASQAEEFASYAAPQQMLHSPGYFRELVAELRRLHPGRELRQTFAQNLLAQIAEDIESKQAPFQQLSDLYRDEIHLKEENGKYLMHQAMRLALGQPLAVGGWEKVDAKVRAYLDEVLALAQITPDEKQLLTKIVSSTQTSDRTALAAKIANIGLRTTVTTALPQFERATQMRPSRLALQKEIDQVGGKLVCSPTGPQWLYLALGDTDLELFDEPTAIDLYNGNNPLKGKGGRNHQVNDAWLEHLAGQKTLKKLDLANCDIHGEGLRHIADLTSLRDLNLTLTPIDDEAFKHMARLTELRSLGLASTQCTGTGFAHLRSLEHLENVNFHFTPLNDAGLKAISQVPISGRLWFAHTRFTDEGAASLAAMTKLKRCGIGSKEKASSGEAVAALVKLPLEDLSLLDNQATPEGIAHAAKIATLRKLDVSHAPGVGDDSVPLVARMPTLEEFILGSAQVTDEGLQALANAKSLRKLTLIGLKKVTPAGIERLRAAQTKLIIDVK